MVYDDSVREEIRARMDIVEQIGSTIQLNRKGTSYTACCPFHKEKTPSFTVNPQRQTYHGFGCGEGGDIFKWIMKQENVTFPEAIELLAKEVGISLPDYSKGEKDRLAPARKALEMASILYQELFWNSSEAKNARDYLLDKRQIKKEIAERFQIGYSLDSWDFLVKNLPGKEGVSLQDLSLAGLVAESPQHQFYDRFRGRLMFPIHDSSGRAIGFSARSLNPTEKGGKYINSPETPLYHKGNVLYGLHLAKKAIHETGKVIVVEGNIDTMRMHQEDHKNTSAPCGTAFTTFHALLLTKKFPGSEILYLFDGDKAGQEATIKTVGKTFWVGNVRASTLPQGKDPAEIYEEGSNISPYLENSQDGLDWLIKTLATKKNFNPKEFSGQQVLVNQFKEFFQDTPQEYREIALEFVAQKLGVQPASLESRLSTKQKKGSHEISDSRVIRENLERQLLYQMAHTHDLDSWSYLFEKRNILDSFQNPCFRDTLDFLRKHFDRKASIGTLFEKPEESISYLLNGEMESGKTLDSGAIDIFFHTNSYHPGWKKNTSPKKQENSETLLARQERISNERKKRKEATELKIEETPKLGDLEATLDTLIAVTISDKMVRGIESKQYVQGLSNVLDHAASILRKNHGLH